MGKVSIKKNVKPKTVKQKQKQKQTQNVTVNIGSISKKRTRTKKSEIQKKQPQQPISQPSIISYNQPIFKQPSQQPIQQPSSLVSSILATQSAPNIVATENRNESALTRALVEQNTNIDTSPEELRNDLERTRKKRLEKFDKPKIPIIQPEPIRPDPIRSALLSQRLGDQGDDTEEIASLQNQSTSAFFRPIQPTSRFFPNAQSSTPSLLSSSAQSYTPSSLSDFLRPASTFSNINFIDDDPYLGGVEESKNSEPPEPTILQPSPPPPTILDPIQPEPTILDTDDNFSEFGSVIDDMLSVPSQPPPELQPIQQEAPLLNEEEDKTINPLNLQPIQPPEPSILQQGPTKTSLTQALKAEEPQQATLIPTLQAEEATPVLYANVEKVIPAESKGLKETKEKFIELRNAGLIDKNIPLYKVSSSKTGRTDKNTQDLLDSIHDVPGYETWEPKGLRKKASKPPPPPPPFQLQEGQTSILDLYGP
jgi:hypothetical protein